MNEEQQWPRHLPNVDEVRRWIVSVLPDHPGVSDTAEVLNAKGWSIVARFNIEGGQQRGTIIFKMVALPEFRCAARLFDLLSRRCPGDVPHLLVWREDEAGRAWMLFRPFVGPSVQETGRFDALLDMARTLARIQSTVAVLPPSETADLPQLPVEHVPDLLEPLVAQIPGKYAAMWNADGGAIRTQFTVPDDLAARMASFLPQLRLWAEELRDCGLPCSVDHVDFLPHNAVVQENGRIIIYDWEQAVLSVPFFSLDILMAFAQGFETSRQASETGQADLILMPEQENARTQELRRAYLDAFAWGTAAQRERAFELAMCLSPIRYAHAEWRLAAKFDQELFWAEDMAWWLTRALRRWERMTENSKRCG